MSTSSKKPSHHVYTVRDGGEQRSDFWTKIGVGPSPITTARGSASS